jgi:hypothetical protein
MIDKRTKMIDNNKIVIECIVCGRKRIIDKDLIPQIKSMVCNCSHKDTYVIVDNLIVTK